jgi:fibronectin-binding autotransporter adhesin
LARPDSHPDTTSQVVAMFVRPSLLRGMRSFFGQNKTLRKVAPALRPHLTQLEDRCTPAFVFVDFGDNFQSGQLTDTLGNLMNLKSGSNPAVNGPDLTFLGNASTSITIQSYNSVFGSSAAANRVAIMQQLRRYFESTDVTVVELTAKDQTINGITFKGASSLADISVTLGLNEGGSRNNDTYALVGMGIVNGDDLLGDIGLAGIANGTDLGNKANLNDDTCLNFVSPSFPLGNVFDADTIAHESGHNLGLRHVYHTSGPTIAGQNWKLLSNSEVMSYNRAFVGSQDLMTMFSRFPTILGDGNGSQNVLSVNAPNNGTYEQLLNDPEVGGNNTLNYVSGTGAHDIIAISKTGTNTAQVTIQPFSNNSYTSAMTVPGIGGTSYTYTISLDKPILIDAGPSDDRLVIDNDLGVTVQFRAMSGVDHVVINDANGATVTFQPGTTKVPSLDTTADFRATLTFAGTTINIQELEPTSSITVNNAGVVKYVSPGGVDKLTAAGAAGGKITVTGTVFGNISAIPFSIVGASSLAFNLGNGDGAGADDKLTLSFTNGSPVPAGGMSYDGGLGTDSIVVTADTDFTLTNALLGLGAFGNVTLTKVESATLTGGASDNLFNVVGWTGAAVLDGGTGTDTIQFSQNADITLAPTSLTTSLGTTIQLASIESAKLSGGASDNTFNLSNWSGPSTVNGLGGTDSIRLIRNANFTATDALISVSDGTSYPVTSIERVELTGGTGDNVFDFNGWSGGGLIDGVGGTDEIRVTRDADFTLSAGSLVISVGLPIGITSIETAALTGGAGNNTFTLMGWEGNATLSGLEGADIYRVTPGTKASTITIIDTGVAPPTGPIDQVQIIGTVGADNYIIEPDAVISGAQRVQYQGVESVSVDGKEGDDTFVTDINKGFFSGPGKTFTLEGGSGLNTFVITGTPAAPIAQSGVLFTGGTTGEILLDPDGSITPSLTGPLNGDEIIIPFSNMSKIGDVTPAARFDFAFGATSDTIAVTDGGIYAGTPTVQVFDGTRGVSVARKTRVVISGGGGTDTFNLDTTAAVPGVTAFDLIGGNGSDSFIVKAVNLPVGLIGADGDDSFLLGSPTGLDNVSGSVTIDGGGGTNGVSLDDAGSAAGNAGVLIGPTGVAGLAGIGGNTIAFVPGTVASLSVTGASAFTNAIAVATLGFPLSLVTGGQDDAIALAAIGAAASVLTGAGNDAVQINGLSAGLALLTQDGNDVVSFNTMTGTPAGSLDAFATPFQFDAGAGSDMAVFNDAADTTGNAYAVGPNAFTRSGGINFTYTNVEAARIFGGGAGDNTYAITGLTAGVTVTDGAGNAQMSIGGDTLGGANSFTGGLGNDAFTFTGEGFSSTATVDGGGGLDTATTRGTAADNALVASIGAAGAGSLAGAGSTLTFNGLETLAVDGAGGNNSLTYADTTPTAGTFTFIPAGAAAGSVSSTGGTTGVNFTNANKSLTYNGGTVRDTLTVLGVSTIGKATGAELTSANGTDTVTVSDALVAIQNTALGTLRSIAIAETAGVPTVKTLLVRVGNEATASADQVTATPSNRASIYIYGGSPTSTPGDKLVVNTVGPRTVSLDSDPNGKPITRVTQLSNGATVGFSEFETAPRIELVAVGTGAGTAARVQVYDASSGQQKLDFFPFGLSFTGGVSVATGDVNGDSYPDIIVGAGPGGAPTVHVYNGITGEILTAFNAYAPSFTGGVQVAAGDVNGDGTADIIIGCGIGGGPHVQVVSGKDFNTRLLNFFAYDPSFRSGVQVAAGDVNGDGTIDVITGAGQGGGPHIRAFSGKNAGVIANFFAFDPNYRGGVNVTAGDINGDGKVDIVAAPASSGSTQVYVYTGFGALQTSFNASTGSGGVLPIAREDGIRLANADLDGDGIKDLITARGRGTLPVVTGYKLGGTTGPLPLSVIRTTTVFDAGFTGGVFVG